MSAEQPVRRCPRSGLSKDACIETDNCECDRRDCGCPMDYHLYDCPIRTFDPFEPADPDTFYRDEIEP